MEKAKTKAKPKKLSYSAHITKAKALWRQSVVWSKADEDGFCTCVTCGIRRAPNDEQMQCGHFIHARKNTYFVLCNAHCQCSRCNKYQQGAPRKYALFIVERYGAETLKWLFEQAEIAFYYRRDFLDRIIEESRIIIKLHGGKPCR